MVAQTYGAYRFSLGTVDHDSGLWHHFRKDSHATIAPSDDEGERTVCWSSHTRPFMLVFIESTRTS